MELEGVGHEVLEDLDQLRTVGHHDWERIKRHLGPRHVSSHSEISEGLEDRLAGVCHLTGLALGAHPCVLE